MERPELTTKKLVPAFRDTVFDPAFGDACLEIAELGLDSLVERGVFSGIPVLGLLTGVGKTILNLRERNFIKQTATFANSFNAGNLDAESYQEYKKKLADDSSFGEKELGRIMLLLETTFDEERSVLLGKMYAAYVNKDINWKDFCEISDAVSRMFVPDIKLLFDINAKRISDTTQCKSYQAERLQSLGLVRMSMKSITVASGGTHATDSYLSCSALGISLCVNALRHGYEFGLNR